MADTIIQQYHRYRQELRQIQIIPDVYADGITVIFEENDGALGISKRFLQKAYCQIREEYTTKRGKMGTGTLGAQGSCDRMLDLTLIILIQTTENLNAINARKSILHYKNSSRLYLEELHFLNVLFASPLQKHTKSPMLWQHRIWILTQLDEAPDFESELEIIYKAGEFHTKNYYAWSYARWLMSYCNPNLSWLAQNMFRKCIKHISDVSMWSFLEHVLNVHGDRELSLKYAQFAINESQMFPGHEAMWMFIRTVLARWGAIDLVLEISCAPTSKEQDLRDNSKKWIETVIKKKHR